MKLKDIRDAKVEGKRVLLRLDLDVPIKNSKIEDDTRLSDGLSTLEYLLKRKATVTIVGHLGRPNGHSEGLSLEEVSKWFLKEINKDLKLTKEKVGIFDSFKLLDNLFVLENIRFFKGEEENDEAFAKDLASSFDVFVNDAFAVSHRKHASIVGVTKFLPSYAGFHLQKEVEELSKILNNPKRPLTVIVGGAKIETKLPLIEKMHHFADYVLVGGKLAGETKELLKVQHEKLVTKKSLLFVADLNNEKSDITQTSLENFLQIVSLSKTIVWNGPMGRVEDSSGQEGTKLLAEGIINSSAYTVVGGGDTIGFLEKISLLSKFDFVSSGGGAMLSFLSGEKLQGIEVLR